MSEDVIRNIYYIENCIYLMFYNTPLPEARLNLDLSFQLMFHPFLDILRFGEGFQCNHVFALLFSGQVNVSEPSSPEKLADVKVTKRPGISRSTFGIACKTHLVNHKNRSL